MSRFLVDEAGCVAEIWPQQVHVDMGYFVKLVVEIVFIYFIFLA